MSGRVLVFAACSPEWPTPESLFALEKAEALGAPVDVLVAAAPGPGVASALVSAGAEHVLVAPVAEPGSERSQPYVDAVVSLVGRDGYRTIVFPSSPLALNVAAGAAARLDAGINWGLVDLRLDDGELVGIQKALDDRFLVECTWTTPVRLALLRGAATTGAPHGRPAQCEPVEVELSEWARQLEVIDEESEADGAANALATAEVIIAGGRGVGGPDGFRLLEEVADALGGSVGATLPVVEAGWYPRSALVGQSGASVAPRVYVACGISGAMQHKVGVEGAELVVAVNSDPAAAIFRWCDVGIVGELQTVLPRVLELAQSGRPWTAATI